MLLSGVWAPVETLPGPLRIISSFIPLTYANNAMRDLFLRGENIIGLIIPISILAGFACFMVLLGIIKLNKTLQ
jgi:ABC-2 type transport system permease protein